MMLFAVAVDHRVKIEESERKDKNLDFASELRNLWNINVTVITIVAGVLGMIPKRLVRGMEEFDIGGQAETIQTTENSPEDPRRLAVDQTPVKNHQLTLERKNLQEIR